MKRITPVLLTAAVLLGTACSSDKKAIEVPDAGDITLPGGAEITLPDDITIPGGGDIPNVDDDCIAVSVEFAKIMSQVYMPTGEEIDWDTAFDNISGRVPEELQDDIQIVGEAYAEYSTILKEHGSDYMSPEVQAAAEALDTPEIRAASDNLEAYFDAACPD